MKKNKKNKVVSWLGGNSEFYSKMLEEDITRRDVLLYNVAVVVFLLGIVIIERHTIAGIVAICTAGLLVNRFVRKDNRD